MLPKILFPVYEVAISRVNSWTGLCESVGGGETGDGATDDQKVDGETRNLKIRPRKEPVSAKAIGYSE
jgi:hypothetical protein